MTAPWIIYTSMRRRWPDGTEFIIRPATDELSFTDRGRRGFQLTLIHSSGLRAHSHHPTVQAAQAHADEFMNGMSGRASA